MISANIGSDPKLINSNKEIINEKKIKKNQKIFNFLLNNKLI